MRLNFSSYSPQPQPVRFGSVRFGETFIKRDDNGKLVDNFGNPIREGGEGQGSCGNGGFGNTYQQDKEDYENALEQLKRLNNRGKTSTTDRDDNQQR